MELLRRYSNTPEQLKPLRRLVEQLGKLDTEESPVAPPSVSSRPSSLPKRVVERLSEEQIQQLIADYHGGMYLKDVAKKYGLGTSSVSSRRRNRMRKSP